eukprot:GFYU01013219.1.p1 GENE.GFYU01013219.1~~GFYU01013219.1.p1  ORF type:complete len:275 (-),score=103.02 GFYU01013219.1:272-1069(-)
MLPAISVSHSEQQTEAQSSSSDDDVFTSSGTRLDLQEVLKQLEYVEEDRERLNKELTLAEEKQMQTMLEAKMHAEAARAAEIKAKELKEEVERQEQEKIDIIQELEERVANMAEEKLAMEAEMEDMKDKLEKGKKPLKSKKKPSAEDPAEGMQLFSMKKTRSTPKLVRRASSVTPQSTNFPMLKQKSEQEIAIQDSNRLSHAERGLHLKYREVAAAQLHSLNEAHQFEVDRLKRELDMAKRFEFKAEQLSQRVARYEKLYGKIVG